MRLDRPGAHQDTMQRVSRQLRVPRVLRDLYRRPASAVGTSLLLLFLFLTAFGPLVSPYGPNEQIYTDVRQGPSLTHLFGTDLLGRDIFSRIVHGARSILSLTGLGALIAVVAGTSFGLFAGYRGGWLDEAIMRVFDSVLAIPALLFALVLLGTVGQSRLSVLVVISVVYTPIVARVVRSETLVLKSRGFVEAARLQGESTAWILFREILPSILPALSVEAALRFSYGIFLVASLGYLGVGVQPPTPDWGLMVREARESVRLIPWALYFPAGAISLLVISINLTADGLKRSLQATETGLTTRSRRRVIRARRAHAADLPPPAGRDAERLLAFDSVTASYTEGGRWLDAVRDVSFGVGSGETVGLVGESGSGKSTLALAAVRYLAGNGAVRRGTIRFEGQDVYRLNRRELREVRGRQIALIPQDPLASLNPSIRVGEQIAEILRWQLGTRRIEATRRSVELLSQVRIADEERTARQYPHQLSGGMQQRVAIAIGLATSPRFVILDEPTTGLDVTTEGAILELLKRLLATGDRGSLYISHDLGVVSQICDRVAVLYAGEMVEIGTRSTVFDAPQHPYTLGLLESIPRIALDETPGELPAMTGSIPRLDELPEGCVFRPRCPLAADVCAVRPELRSVSAEGTARCHRIEDVSTLRSAGARRPEGVRDPRQVEDPGSLLRAEGIRTHFPLRRSVGEVLECRPRRVVRAVEEVSIDLAGFETLGLVGESGSGKTTFARALLGIEPATSGAVVLGGRPVPRSLSRRDRDDLRRLQAVAQHPDQALNPYRSIGSSLRRPFIRLAGLGWAPARAAVGELLARVGLSSEHAGRTPDRLSGGEKQRVAIARAFATHPSVVLCDEATSSLDVSVQALVLNLLQRLQRESGSATLFITHDLSVVAHLADRIAVMYLGRLMEIGGRDEVLSPPYHPYTEALLSAFPGLGRRADAATTVLSGEVPSPVDPPSGCPFHTRCPRRIGPVCQTELPPWRSASPTHEILCHIAIDVLAEEQSPVFVGRRGGEA